MVINLIEFIEKIEYKENIKCIRFIGLFIGMVKVVLKWKWLKIVCVDGYFEIFCLSI